ncbi:alpha-E domain-containing protein [Adlercreutzia faecimuris]|uniref:Alpha-E domain-containing protein n=1 Tax=Adlercreutzia faecimuris TaxID=2897341 RepID=A0ABS9WDG2_9ACTN|nr:alpha-E domain-containing protein [Adlercreutzia sp. JBNU-10]MCI2240888.1 alpha-E domain-containing protein [Adlercreutzia sp. JBNU-10]
MGSLSLERVGRLLWLGRYVERSYTTLQFILATYDAALDSVEGNWKGQLEELGFDQENDDPIAFFRECLFSRELTASIYYSMSAAYDNAVVLRDVIGSESVAYVQMALNDIERAEHSDAPLLDLQTVIDCILAFKGSCDDYVVNDAARNIIKCGFSIERMDLYTRLSYQLGDLRRETQKLASRIDRTGLPYDRAAFKELIDAVFSPRFPEKTTYEELGVMLELIARVF